AMRKSDANGVFVQTTQKDGKATVTLDAVQPDGRFLNEAPAELTVIEPHGDEKKLAMTQTAPGRYVAEFPADKPGAYHVHITQHTKTQGATQQPRGLVINYEEELRIKPVNETLLQSVAQASGGKYKPEPEAVFAADERTASQAVPLWPWFLIAAAVIFVAD